MQYSTYPFNHAVTKKAREFNFLVNPRTCFDYARPRVISIKCFATADNLWKGIYSLVFFFFKEVYNLVLKPQ